MPTEGENSEKTLALAGLPATACSLLPILGMADLSLVSALALVSAVAAFGVWWCRSMGSVTSQKITRKNQHTESSSADCSSVRLLWIPSQMPLKTISHEAYSSLSVREDRSENIYDLTEGGELREPAAEKPLRPENMAGQGLCGATCSAWFVDFRGLPIVFDGYKSQIDYPTLGKHRILFWVMGFLLKRIHSHPTGFF